MHVIVVDNYQELSRKAAIMILNQIVLQPSSSIGFCTGSTPEGVYDELVERFNQYSYDFSKTKAFALDEYIGLSAKHSQSYSYALHSQLFNHVNFKKQNIHVLDGLAQDLKKECEHYEQLLKKHPIDIQLLGIGENGHIGFNEPGSSKNSTTRLVELTQNTQDVNARFFDSVDEVPQAALSMGIATIMQAGHIVLLANGTKKAKAVQSMIEGPVTSDCPASILQDHPNVTVILDKAAASRLSKDYSDTKNGWTDVRIFNKQVVPQGKRVLVISPHPDDSVVSCGATIAGLAQNNQVHIAVMTTGYRAAIGTLSRKQRIALRRREARAEARVLGVKVHFLECQYYDQGHTYWKDDLKKLHELWRVVQPDIILLPHEHDEHPTHGFSTQLVRDYVMQKNLSIQLWYYEGVWSQHILTTVNQVFCFDDSLLKVKNRALRQHKSQVSRIPLLEITNTLSRFRALTLPEQRFVTYGAEPPNLSKYVEAYFVEQV